ncbi:MAG: radical SAM family heme chaperone HemW [Alphaproteobacteria bacterium]|nr:radical SAM family heme chaperone HemW [Alphaproteobacteria bacterium]
MLPLAVYIHWPFCKFKCPYCDFNSHVREKINHPEWQRGYLDELRYYREQTGPRLIKSIFFGGGTPSLMEPATVAAVISEVDKLWGLPAGTEVTLEANPTSVEVDKLRGFKAAGVNRVSLGVQSLRDAALRKLGRQHSAAEALAAVKTAASVFERYSFDLIYARPEQSLAGWKQELEEALEYSADHMSLYQLTIEEGTAYHTLHQRGELKIPDENAAADMYELTQEMMDRRGLPAYEISNHARPGAESQHNLVYWRYGDYAGVGPGAHGRLTIKAEKLATRAHKAPEVWLERVRKERHGSHPFEVIDFFKRGQEMLMMGLRLRDGVLLDDFLKETHTPLSRFIHAQRLQALLDEGFMELTEQHLRATAAGRQRLNAVLSHLVSQ